MLSVHVHIVSDHKLAGMSIPEEPISVNNAMKIGEMKIHFNTYAVDFPFEFVYPPMR